MLKDFLAPVPARAPTRTNAANIVLNRILSPSRASPNRVRAPRFTSQRNYGPVVPPPPCVPPPPVICSGCGQKVIEASDIYQREVRDLPWSALPVTVVMELYRVRCPDCGLKTEKGL